MATGAITIVETVAVAAATAKGINITTGLKYWLPKISDEDDDDYATMTTAFVQFFFEF